MNFLIKRIPIDCSYWALCHSGQLSLNLEFQPFMFSSKINFHHLPNIHENPNEYISTLTLIQSTFIVIIFTLISTQSHQTDNSLYENKPILILWKLIGCYWQQFYDYHMTIVLLIKKGILRCYNFSALLFGLCSNSQQKKCCKVV